VIADGNQLEEKQKKEKPHEMEKKEKGVLRVG